MIGNDLVYLPGWSKAEGKRLVRFKNKLFTSGEQTLIADYPDYGEALFWSAKEAVYKIGYRVKPTYSYAPKSIEILQVQNVDEYIYCDVEYEGNQYITRSKLHLEYLHTLALEGDNPIRFEKVLYALQEHKRGDPKILIQEGGRLLISIEKDGDGIPLFPLGSKYSGYSLSLSHDGALIGMAWISETD